MSTVSNLAEEIRHELESTHPNLRKTILKKLPLLVAVMLEAQTANTAELAAILPLTTLRSDMRLQWISRLLSNPLLVSNKIVDPFARELFAEVSKNDPLIVLTMDQERLGDRFVILMVSLRIRDRIFPLVWRVETETGNLGFEWQRVILEQMVAWLPEKAKVLLMVERIAVAEGLFHWILARGWKYRIHLSNNFPTVVGNGEVTTLEELLKNVTAEAPVSNVRLFEGRVVTSIGKQLNAESGESQIIALDNLLTPAIDRGTISYQGIDAVFAGFRSKGFSLKDTQLHYAIRIDHLVLVMSLAMYWCRKIEYRNRQCLSIQDKSVDA
ncbi:conserved hypothetical protein [Gammaproteobacteria bacterium]